MAHAVPGYSQSYDATVNYTILWYNFYMIGRAMTARILAGLTDAPVVVVQGARQVGKTTLIKNLLETGAIKGEYHTLDNLPTLAAVQQDHLGFLERAKTHPLILDEVQRAPDDLFVSIKADVDRDRKPGRFLLTGSANALFVPRLADALVGRVDLVTLYPFAQAEIEGVTSNLVDVLASGRVLPISQLTASRHDVLTRALQGGYPPLIDLKREERRQAWFDSYVSTILQRDVLELSKIQGLDEMPLLLTLLAARAATTLNIADVSRSARIPVTTLNRYLTLFAATYLIHMVQPWSTNLNSRLVKAPKVLMVDTGLLAYALDVTLSQLELSPALLGPLVENFAGMELIKLLTWSKTRGQLYHFRTHDRKEVDYVLECGGRVIGVEVKAANGVGAQDFKGLEALKQEAGDRWQRGVVLYTGQDILPFGPDLQALPIAALWSQLG